MNSRHRIDIEPIASSKPLKRNYNVQSRPKSSNQSLLTKTHKPGNIPSYIKRPNKLILEAQLVEKQRKYASLKQTLSTTQTEFDIQRGLLMEFQRKLERLGWIGKLIKIDGNLTTLGKSNEFGDTYEGDSNTGQQKIESTSILSLQKLPESLQELFLKAHTELELIFAEKHEPSLQNSNDVVRTTLKTLEQNVAILFSKFSNQDEVVEQSFPASTVDLSVISQNHPESTYTQTDPVTFQQDIDKIRGDQSTVAMEICQLNNRIQEIESLSALQRSERLNRSADLKPCKKPATAEMETNTTDVDCMEACTETGDLSYQTPQYLVIKSLLSVKTKRIEQKNKIIHIMGQHFRREINRFSKQAASVSHQNQELNQLCEEQKATNLQLQSQVDELQLHCSEHSKCVAIYQRILRVRCELLDMIKKKCTLRPYYLMDIFSDIGSRLPSRKQVRLDPATRANQMCDLFASLNDQKQRTIINVLEDSHKRNLHARMIQLNRIARLEKQVAHLQLQLQEVRARAAPNAAHYSSARQLQHSHR